MLSLHQKKISISEIITLLNCIAPIKEEKTTVNNHANATLKGIDKHVEKTIYSYEKFSGYLLSFTLD